MDIRETSSKSLVRKFDIVIKKETINKSVDEKIAEVSKQANLPGFRPGKVPLSVP